MNFELAVVGACFWGLLIVVWVGRAILVIADRRFTTGLRWLLAWLVMPIALGVAISAVEFNVPLKTRLFLSSSELRQVAADAGAGRSQPVHSSGLFDVAGVEPIPNGARIAIRNSNGLAAAGGFAYSPEGWPPSLGNDEYWHLYGPWYRWSRRL